MGCIKFINKRALLSSPGRTIAFHRKIILEIVAETEKNEKKIIDLIGHYTVVCLVTWP